MLSRLGPMGLRTTRAATPAPGWLHVDLAEIASAAEAERALRGQEFEAMLCVAGMTNVEGCEDEQAAAMQVNATAPASFAAVARQRGIPFVYFSTEYVFDGEAGPYLEDDEAHPISVYGRSKWEGELGVRAAHPDALILRTTVVYGQDAGEKNFLYSLMRNLRAGKEMRVPEDQISTPTYNMDLAKATEMLLAKEETGVFHVCGPELLSRLEFAQAIARELGLDEALVRGVATADLKQKAPRPLRAGLRTHKLRRVCPQAAMRPLHEALMDCRESMHRFLAGVPLTSG